MRGNQFSFRYVVIEMTVQNSSVGTGRQLFKIGAQERELSQKLSQEALEYSYRTQMII